MTGITVRCIRSVMDGRCGAVAFAAGESYPAVIEGGVAIRATDAGGDTHHCIYYAHDVELVEWFMRHFSGDWVVRWVVRA